MNQAVLLRLSLRVIPVLALFGCGSSEPPTTTPTTTQPPATTPTTTMPPITSLCTDPTPPPLYGMRVKVQSDSGNRKLLDSWPLVENVGRGTPSSYCGTFGLGVGDRFCPTRPEGHPQRAACDALAVGRAKDTGRYGPTWYHENERCAPSEGTGTGCTNHADNQFLVIARGGGTFFACAADDVPLSENGDRPPCGACVVEPANPLCKQ